MEPLTQPPEISTQVPTQEQISASGTTERKKRKSKLKSNRSSHAQVTQDQVAAALAASRARVAAEGARDVNNAQVGASANDIVDLTSSPKTNAGVLPTKTPKLSAADASASITPTPLQTASTTAAANHLPPAPTLTINEGEGQQQKSLKVRTDSNRVSLDPNSTIVGDKRTVGEVIMEEKKAKVARVSLEGDTSEKNVVKKSANTNRTVEEKARKSEVKRDAVAEAKAKKDSVKGPTKSEVKSSEKKAASSSAASNTTAAPTKTSAKANTTTKPQPIKAKKKKRSFHDQILYTMLTSSKPYTLKSLAQACDTTTEALNHAMLSFLDKQLVLSKEFPSKKGEKKLFWANPLSESELGGKSAISKEFSKLLASKEEMAEADKTQHDLTQKLRGIGEELRPLLAIPTLKQLDDDISTEEKELQRLQSEITAIRHRMEEASKPKPKPLVAQTYNRFRTVPAKPRDKMALKRNINHYVVEYKKRKRQCMDFVDHLADAMEKPTKDAVKTLDLETDESEWGVWMDCGTNKIYGSKRGKGVLSEEDVKVRIPGKYDL